MRVLLAITVVLVTGLLITAAASRGCKSPRSIKHRTKPREIRGFKPEYISTAIGFGKRERPAENPNFGAREEILLPSSRDFSRGIPAEVLLRAMQTNPALVGELMQLSKQNDDGGDEESTMNRSKSERSLELF